MNSSRVSPPRSWRRGLLVLGVRVEAEQHAAGQRQRLRPRRRAPGSAAGARPCAQRSTRVSGSYRPQTTVPGDALGEVAGRVVEVPEQLGGARAGRGQPAQRVARGDHAGHRVDAVTGDVPHHEQQVLARQQQRVVPVPADQPPGLGRAVAHRDVHPRGRHRRLVLRHDRALQPERELVLLARRAARCRRAGRGSRPAPPGCGSARRRPGTRRAAPPRRRRRATGSAKMRICLIAVSPGRTMRNTATAGSRPVQQRLPEPPDRRAVRRDHEAVQARRWGSARPAPGRARTGRTRSSVQRTVPVARFSSQPPMRPSRCAWPSRSASRSGSPSLPPGEDHARRRTATARRSATSTASVAAGRAARSAWRAGGTCSARPLASTRAALANRPSPDADAGYASSRVSAGQLGGRAAGRVHVAGAQVHDGEVGQRAARVAQRPDDQHGLGDLVKRPNTPARRRRRPDGAVGQAHAEHVGEPGDRGRHPGPWWRRRSRRAAPATRLRPRRAGRPPGPAAPSTARAAAPAPRRGGGHRSAGGRPGQPPQVLARRRPPAAPGSRTAAAAAASGSTRCRRGRPAPSSSSAPSASSSHTATAATPNRGPQLLGEGADELGAVPAPARPPRWCHGIVGQPSGSSARLWLRRSRPRTAAPGRARRRPSRAPAAPRRRPCRRAGGRASADDQPCRSISTPLAIATTAAASRLGPDAGRARAAGARRPRTAAARPHRVPASITSVHARPLARRDAETVPS